MILVTLGTQDKSFVRLLKAIDREIKKWKYQRKGYSSSRLYKV